MQFEPTENPDVLIIQARRIGDARGFFLESFRQDLFETQVPGVRFVQDNHSFSAEPGTVRGLHAQRTPMAQGKLVRVTAGAIFDVAVDIRVGSPHFGRAVCAELSARNDRQLWIPAGFLHGFCTLEPNTEVQYKVTGPYSASHDVSVAWHDPQFSIPWPAIANPALLSRKDAEAPLYAQANIPFTYGPAR